MDGQLLHWLLRLVLTNTFGIHLYHHNITHLPRYLPPTPLLRIKQHVTLVSRLSPSLHTPPHWKIVHPHRTRTEPPLNEPLLNKKVLSRHWPQTRHPPLHGSRHGKIPPPIFWLTSRIYLPTSNTERDTPMHITFRLQPCLVSPLLLVEKKIVTLSLYLFPLQLYLAAIVPTSFLIGKGRNVRSHNGTWKNNNGTGHHKWLTLAIVVKFITTSIRRPFPTKKALRWSNLLIT